MTCHFQSFNEEEGYHIRFLAEDHNPFIFAFEWERGATGRASWLAGVLFPGTLPEVLWDRARGNYSITESKWQPFVAVLDSATKVKGSRLPVHNCSVVTPQEWWCWCSPFLKTQRCAVGWRCASVGCMYRYCAEFPWSNGAEDSICFARKLPDIRLSICTELLTWWTGSNDPWFNFTAD